MGHYPFSYWEDFEYKDGLLGKKIMSLVLQFYILISIKYIAAVILCLFCFVFLLFVFLREKFKSQLSPDF